MDLNDQNRSFCIRSDANMNFNLETILLKGN